MPPGGDPLKRQSEHERRIDALEKREHGPLVQHAGDYVPARSTLHIVGGGGGGGDAPSPIAAFAYCRFSGGTTDGVNTAFSYAPVWAMQLQPTFPDTSEAHEAGGWTFSNQTLSSADWGSEISLVSPNEGWFTFGGEAKVSLYFDAAPTTLRYLDFRIHAYCEPVGGGSRHYEIYQRRWVDSTEIAAHYGPYVDRASLSSLAYFPTGAGFKRFFFDVVPNSGFDTSEGPTDMIFNAGGNVWARSS